MSNNIFFISDLHLGHANLVSWRNASITPTHNTVDEHDWWLVEQWNSVVRKRDVVWVLGDVVWKHDRLPLLVHMNGSKHLIMGNHDKLRLGEYLKYFSGVRPGLWGYKGFWLSHCPIHPLELRGRNNIHGHVHNATIPDERYVNVSVEANNGVPISLEAIRSRYEE